VGKAFRIDDAIGRYIVFLKNTFPAELDLEGLKLVVDCGNGAAYKIAPAVFEELGASITAIGISPNGKNINAECGSLYPDQLKEEVLKTGANLGIAFDGDADRVIFVDETGTEINGDQIMAICALDLLGRNKLAENTVVATVMSNMGLEKALEPQGVKVVRTQVGDRYVVEEMRRQSYNFGGEQSGHLIFMDHNTTGDGILSALQLLSVLVRTGKPLSELAKVMTTYPQLLKNIPVRHKPPLEQIPVLHQRIQEIEMEIQGRGRLLVRYSGTENKLRVMMEGESVELISAHVDDLAELVQQHLGQEVN
jgi:phosphoglucosamine mutase